MPSKALDALFVAPEIAPLSSGTGRGRAMHALARALTSVGVNITVVAPRAAGQRPEALGLARWLEPLALPGAESVTVYGDSLPSGGGQLLVLDAGEAADLRVVARAAVELARSRGPWPDVVHATEDTAEALALVREQTDGERPAPATVLTAVADLSPEAELPSADRVVAPSRQQALALSAAGAPAIAIGHGIDEARWSPSRDPHLPAKFSAADPSGKATCKLELQRELGLPPRAKEPLIAALSPLGDAAVTGETADALAQTGAQLAFLVDPDRDDARSRQAARDLASRYPTRVATREGFDESLAHRLLGGADFALILRRGGEPGMSDLHPLAYGAIPIAPRWGEYADRLVDVDPRTATGLGLLYPPEGGADLVVAVSRAIRAFHDRALVDALTARALAADLSWKTTAHRYLEVYREALRTRTAHAA